MTQSCAYAAHVISPKAHIDLNTDKVVTLHDPVEAFSAIAFVSDVVAVSDLPGPLLVIIDSPGGSVTAGDQMIEAIETVKESGVKVICVASNNAHSMAFNLLTHCDVRLATPNTTMVVHKIEATQLNYRKTARNLRVEADYLERRDEKYRQANARAMHMTLEQYDQCADNETEWGALMLLKRGYLHGLCSLSK